MTTDTPAFSLNDEQQAAVTAIAEWLKAPSSASPFFVLSGSAGTGKTYCIRALLSLTKGRFIFTAPTNKATKVLRESVSSKDYRPECRTIFSLLGLRLEPNGEVKELSVPEDPVDLSQYKAVIVDEGSMISSTLMFHIRKAAEEAHVKFIFMGDAAQLPPVGEQRSPIWRLQEAGASSAVLERVMRYDNQILTLAQQLRARVDHPAPSISLRGDNADGEGVFKVGEVLYDQRLLEAVDRGEFSRANGAKAIAWRNITVDALNKRIRAQLFGNSGERFLPSDRVLFTQPAKDLDDEVIATTDDEGVIDRLVTEPHPIHGLLTYRISITLDDNRHVLARVLHESAQGDYTRRSEELAARARENKRYWPKFWDFKDAFHGLRHAYAITAHRSQGSTYDTAFVDWRDILLNRNRQEAFRCLYVACTRPKRVLVFA